MSGMLWMHAPVAKLQIGGHLWADRSPRVDTPARLRYAFQFAHPVISLRAVTRALGSEDPGQTGQTSAWLKKSFPPAPKTFPSATPTWCYILTPPTPLSSLPPY